MRQLVIIVSALLLLSGCVTTTTGGFSEKKSPQRSVENYTQLGVGYLQQGRTDWARDRLQKALEIEPDNAEANAAMGMVWQTEGELQLAETSYKKAISSDRKYTRAYHQLGRMYSANKRYDEAEKYLQKATEDPYYEARPTAFNDLAISYYRSGNESNAIDTYKETLRLSPYNVDALVNLSTLLFESQRYDESQKYFTRFDRLAERSQTRHNAHSLWLGIKLATIRRDTRKAIELAQELKQNFPDSNEYAQYQRSLEDAKG